MSSQALNRYAYVLNNPLRYTDPDGHNPLLAAAVGGFFIGGLVSIGTQAYDNFRQGQDLGQALLNVDLGKAAGAAVGGAIFGVTMAVAAPATLIGALGVGTVGGVLGGQTGRAVEAAWDEATRVLSGQGWNAQHLLQSCIDNGVLDPTSIAVDAAAGFVSAGAGYGITKALSGAGLVNNPLLSPTVSGRSGPTITLYRPQKGMILLDTGQRTLRFDQSTFDRLMYYLSVGLFDKAAELISEVAGQQTQEILEGATP
ncbi:MAG: hypothetical protein N2508_13790 [Anaerolineae bacterium]|nr:hypothetical protein [Anaerolineae bacterium]